MKQNNFKGLYPQVVHLDTKKVNWTKLLENFRQKFNKFSVKVQEI